MPSPDLSTPAPARSGPARERDHAHTQPRMQALSTSTRDRSAANGMAPLTIPKPSPPPLVVLSSAAAGASPITSGSPPSAGSPLTLTSSLPYSALPSSDDGDYSLAQEIEVLTDLAKSLRSNLRQRPLKAPPLPANHTDTNTRRADSPPTMRAPDAAPAISPPPKSQLRGKAARVTPLDPSPPRHSAPGRPPAHESEPEGPPVLERASSQSGASADESETLTPPPPAGARTGGEKKERVLNGHAVLGAALSSPPPRLFGAFKSSPSPSPSPAPPMSVPAGHPQSPCPISSSALLSLLPAPSAASPNPTRSPRFHLPPSPRPRPLIIDTRPLPLFLQTRLAHSVNLAIPSLILKRTLKPGGSSAFASLDFLRGYITTDSCRETWDELLRGGEEWNGDVVLYDEDMDDSTRASKGSSTAWTLTALLVPLVAPGTVLYLSGGFSGLRSLPQSRPHLISGPTESSGQEVTYHHNHGSPSLVGQELTVNSAGLSDMSATPRGTPAPGTGRSTGSAGSAGLFSLRTDVASHRGRRVVLEVDPPTSGPAPPNGHSAPAPAPHPARVLALPKIADASPSPPPSATHFPRTPRRLNTASAEHLRIGAPGAGGLPSPMLPKLQLRCTPLRSATLPVPPSPGLLRITPPSPGYLGGGEQMHSPLPLSPLASPLFPPPSPGIPRPLTPTSSHSQTPQPQQPGTPETSAAHVPFTVSCILPDFLYLGPEPTTDEEVEQLLELGIRRVLNMAEECEDDKGLGLRRKFEMYERVPMRDTVDEENIGKGVKAACLFLDDARLHSSPTYVHCKAGKSRSVTVVMGYLIHANSWPLSKAYEYVTEKRQGCSPNIGFVSELMKFEEAVLGTKSIGVGQEALGGSKGAGGAGSKGMGMGMRGGRRGPHVRESLPPAMLYRGGSTEDVLLRGRGSDDESDEDMGGGMSMGGRLLGDAATEMEVKDSEGRYVHARRVPVDRQTLQPQRRVSKAGLESAWVP